MDAIHNGVPYTRLVMKITRDSIQNAVFSLLEAPRGQLWVGRANGVELRDARDGLLLHTRQPASSPASILNHIRPNS